MRETVKICSAPHTQEKDQVSVSSMGEKEREEKKIADSPPLIKGRKGKKNGLVGRLEVKRGTISSNSSRECKREKASAMTLMRVVWRKGVEGFLLIMEKE